MEAVAQDKGKRKKRLFISFIVRSEASVSFPVVGYDGENTL